jgi:hypothetical protein
MKQIRQHVTLLYNFMPEIHGLYRLLKHKRKLSKLWQETRDPACKNGSKLGRLKYHEDVPEGAPERWETNLANCDVISQATWPITKS